MPAPEIINDATFAAFLDSLGGDVEFLSELVEAYLDSSPELFASMRQAIASGEAPTLQRAAHSLKTGSATFGALAFAAQCKEMEDLGKTGALDEAQATYGALETEYAGVVAALEAQLADAGPAPS